MKNVSRIIILLVGMLFAAHNVSAIAINENDALVKVDVLLDGYSGRASDLVEARDILNRVLGQYPNNAIAHKEMARLLVLSVSNSPKRKREAYGAAEKLLQKAIALDDDYVHAYVNLAHIYLEQDKMDLFDENIEKASIIEKDNPWLKFAIASAYEKKQEYGNALDVYRDLIDKEVDSDKLFRAYHSIADIHRKTGSMNEACSAFEKAIQWKPRDAWTRGNYALLLVNLGDYDKAIEYAQSALKIMDYGMVRTQLAKAYYGKWSIIYNNDPSSTEADSLYQAALSLNSNISDIAIKLLDSEKTAHIIKSFLRVGKVDVDASYKHNNTLLGVAVLKNNLAAVKMLLELGSDPNRRIQGKHHPLIIACEYPSGEIAAELIKYGAEIDVSASGDNPLRVAAKYGHIETVKFLLKKGGEHTLLSKKGIDSYLIAKEKGRTEVANFLEGKLDEYKIAVNKEKAVPTNYEKPNTKEIVVSSISRPVNFLDNGNAENGIEPWFELWTLNGELKIEKKSNGEHCFVVKNGARFMQKFKINPAREYYALLISRMTGERLSGEIDSPRIFLNRYLRNPEKGKGNVLIGYANSSAKAPNQWAINYVIADVSDKHEMIMVKLNQRWEKGYKFEGNEAKFDDVGLFFFNTRKEAKDFASKYASAVL